MRVLLSCSSIVASVVVYPYPLYQLSCPLPSCCVYCIQKLTSAIFPKALPLADWDTSLKNAQEFAVFPIPKQPIINREIQISSLKIYTSKLRIDFTLLSFYLTCTASLSSFKVFLKGKSSTNHRILNPCLWLCFQGTYLKYFLLILLLPKVLPKVPFLLISARLHFRCLKSNNSN